MVVLLGLLTQFLWNFIMPDIFGFPVINFWQGLAMFALAKLIFVSAGRRSATSGRLSHTSMEARVGREVFKTFSGRTR